ncbi:MAG: cell division inhibitor SulA [Moritella dasanensis]|jgi:cell division inhibitor SulA
MQTKSFTYNANTSADSNNFLNADDAVIEDNHGQWTAIIAPPMTLTAALLSQHGISANSALIIHKAKINNKFHTLLKAAQSPTISTVVTWDDELTTDEIFQVKATMKSYNTECVIQSNKKLH